MTLEEINSNIAAIETGIAKNVLEVEIVVDGDRKRERFPAFDDMLARIRYFEKKKKELTGKSKRIVRLNYNPGFY